MLNYYLDITEEEYTDTTYVLEATSMKTKETTVGHPTFEGYKYRSMQ